MRSTTTPLNRLAAALFHFAGDGGEVGGGAFAAAEGDEEVVLGGNVLAVHGAKAVDEGGVAVAVFRGGLAGSAEAGSSGVAGIIDSSLGLGFSIASLAGRS